MPELPEVEIIRLGLQKKIVGLKIKKIEILTPKSFIGGPKIARGKTVLNIWRRAKMLGIELTSSLRATAKQSQNMKKIATSPSAPRNDGLVTLLFHLKMTGQLIYDDGKRFVGGHPTLDMVGELPNKSTRVIFTFSDNSKLYFNDQRRFGWIRVIEGKRDDWGIFDKLGPEPLEKEFTWEILRKNLLRHKSMAVKVALLDQGVVSGIGNIYANEACFAAGVDPRTKVGDLGDKELRKLHEGVIRVIKEGIKHGGSTRAHFVDSEGRKGYFLDYAKVYWRDKHPCKVCGEIIKKIQLGGRGTYFCPKCQT